MLRAFAIALLAITAPGHAATTDDASVIRSLRFANNVAIERHDGAQMAALWRPNFTLIESDGTVFRGVAGLRASYEGEEFRDRAFVQYRRVPERITISGDGRRAAESGQWTAVYRDHRAAATGTYLAEWIQSSGRWMLQWESYIRLGTTHNE